MNAPLLSALGEWPSFLRTVDHHRHRVCSDRNQDTKRSALLTLFSACCLFLFLSLGAAAQTTILSEGFEGNFPADNGWSVVDSNASGTTAYWDDVNSAFGGEGTHTGNYKGYCAGIGYTGTTASPLYQNSMTSYMSKTLNLAGYSSANLSCWYRIPSMEPGGPPGPDKCRIYIDGELIFERTVAVTSWTQKTEDLTRFVGGTHTLKFEFVSDPSVTAEGWYLDDILVTGTPAPATGTLNVTVRNSSGTAMSGAGVSRYTSTWSSIDSKTTNSSGIASWSGIAVGSYNLEAYFNGEYWGNAVNASVTAGNTTNVTIQRYEPYAYDYKVFSGSTDVTGGTVPYGTALSHRVYVANDGPASRTVRVRFRGRLKSKSFWKL